MIQRAIPSRLRELIPLIEEFYASSKFLRNFNADHCEEVWIKFITDGVGVIFLLEENGKIIGFLAALKYPDINSGELVATELAWFVKSTRRRKGLLLLKEFEEWAKKEKCKRVIMVHLMDSMPDKLRRVYEGRGYRAMEINYGKEI